MSRTVPPFIREGLITALNSVLDSMDFSLGMASLANIQLHLMISVNDGLWKRGPMGRAAYAAARMAIGLVRDAQARKQGALMVRLCTAVLRSRSPRRRRSCGEVEYGVLVSSRTDGKSLDRFRIGRSLTAQDHVASGSDAQYRPQSRGCPLPFLTSRPPVFPRPRTNITVPLPPRGNTTGRSAGPSL